MVSMHVRHEAARVVSQRFSLREAEGALQIDGSLLPLTPTQYRLCLCFLVEESPSAVPVSTSDLVLIAFASLHVLVERVYRGKAERSRGVKLIRKHVNNLHNKLSLYGLYFCSYAAGGEQGYLLFEKKEIRDREKSDPKRFAAQLHRTQS